MKKLIFLVFIMSCAVLRAEDFPGNMFTVGTPKGETFFVNVDSSSQEGLKIWICQNHEPPARIDPLPGNIFRTCTRYLFSPDLHKYSIIEIRYLGPFSEEIGRFNYEVPSGGIKYSSPVLKESTIEFLLKKILPEKFRTAH